MKLKYVIAIAILLIISTSCMSLENEKNVIISIFKN